MGKDAKSKELSSVGQTAGNWYNQLQSGPTPLEREFTPISQDFYNTYKAGVGQNMQDYGNIMGGYNAFSQGLGGPTKFGYQGVSAVRPEELSQAYGYLNEAAPGYREFAQTGGYSPTDIQELRARGMSPITATYGNTMMELNRARALGGAGGAPNYIAAASAAQRQLPGQLAEAMTGVNAKLAEDIRTGRLAGLAGLTGVGGTMGGLAGAESGRMLQASMANQAADLQAQQLSEQSLQNLRNAQLQSLAGQVNLYGTTPAMAATFGNQALSAYNQRGNLEQLRNQLGMGLLDAQIRAYGGQTAQKPWWQQALGAAGSAIPYLGQMFGGGGTNPAYPGATNVSPYANPNPGVVNNGYYPGGGNYDQSGWYPNSPMWDPYGGYGNMGQYYNPMPGDTSWYDMGNNYDQTGYYNMFPFQGAGSGDGQGYWDQYSQSYLPTGFEGANQDPYFDPSFGASSFY